MTVSLAELVPWLTGISLFAVGAMIAALRVRDVATERERERRDALAETHRLTAEVGRLRHHADSDRTLDVTRDARLTAVEARLDTIERRP